jgi:hypothetical protein
MDAIGRDGEVHNVVQGYRMLAAPLDQLIADLTALQARAARQDVIKQPDLDEAPAAYRPAVSDYFEKMSRDYHPDESAPPAEAPAPAPAPTDSSTPASTPADSPTPAPAPAPTPADSPTPAPASTP